MDWIWFLGSSVKRVDSSSILNEDTTNSFDLKLKKNKYHAVWYRRNSSPKLMDIKDIAERIKEQTNQELYWFLEEEYIIAKSGYLSSLFENSVISLGHFESNNINKLTALILANKNGIKTPLSFVTDNKDDLMQWVKKNNIEIITKGVSSSLKIQDSNLSSYTEELSLSRINNLPTKFFLSMFQEKIDKKYEVRTFFLNDKCYSMAIFSQLDNQTSVDFRRYNTKRPNRKIRFKHTKEEESKIISLMKSLNLNTGSLDFIVDCDNSLVFLEVNPQGQYSMTSEPCNYNLDRKIAEFLLR